MKNKSTIIIVIIVLVFIAVVGYIVIQKPAFIINDTGNDKISDIKNDLNKIPDDSIPNQGLDSLNQNIQNL